MIRFLMISILLANTSSASAAGVPKPQRRAMGVLVQRFSPTLTKSDVRAFVDAEAEELGAMTNAEREARVEVAARWTAETIDATIRSVRAGDPEDTRANLNELLRQLAKAGGLLVTPSREEVGSMSYAVMGATVVGGIVTGVGGMMGSMVHMNFELLMGGMGGAMASTIFGAGLMGFFQGHTSKLRLPGGRTLARRYTKNDVAEKFWSLVRTHVKETADAPNSPEALGQLIARELKVITLNQACTSALLLEATRAKVAE